MTPAAPGTRVPDFSLTTERGEEFTQEDLDGQTTVLVFYPAAFSPGCSDQFHVYQEVLGELDARGAKLYGVSVDSSWAVKAFRRHLGVDIPQLSDFEPKGETCRAFGVYHAEPGTAQRALIVIGPDRVVRWSYQAEHPGMLPGANLIFDGLGAVPA